MATYEDILDSTCSIDIEIGDLQNYIDVPLFSISSEETIQDLQSYIEVPSFSIASAESIQDLQNYIETPLFSIVSVESILDLQHYIEGPSFTIVSSESIHDAQHYLEPAPLYTTIISLMNIRDKQNFSENRLITIVSQTLPLFEYPSSKAITFGFNDVESSSIDRWIDIAVRGRQLSGPPNSFPLSAIIKVGSSWRVLKHDEIFFSSNWETVFWEKILTRKFTSNEISSLQLRLVPRDDISQYGIGICEIRLFVVEPRYEVFDVSLDISNSKEYNTREKANYIKSFEISADFPEDYTKWFKPGYGAWWYGFRHYGLNGDAGKYCDYSGILGTWRQINEDGFENSNNNPIAGSCVFDDKLYFAVDNAPEGIGLFSFDGSSIVPEVPYGFGDPNNFHGGTMIVYNGDLYCSPRNLVSGCPIWRKHNGVWDKIAPDGFEDVNNEEIQQPFVYDGKLWMSTLNSVTGVQMQVFDGDTWSQMNLDGFGSASYDHVFGAVIYKDNLYVGASAGAGIGLRIFRYDGGTTWTQVNTDGFGTSQDGPNYPFFKVMDDYLFCFTTDYSLYASEIWRYDGSTWTNMRSKSLGYYYYVPCIFKGSLFVVYSDVNWGVPSGVSHLLKYQDGDFIELPDTIPYVTQVITNYLDSWLIVATYAFSGVAGPLYSGGDSGILPLPVTTPGFGDSNNIYDASPGHMQGFVDSFEELSAREFKGKLYVATYNSTTGAEIWEYDPFYD